MLAHPGIFALNHLLEAEASARDKLKPYAGQCVEFRNPPLPVLRLVILDTGLLAAAAEDAVSNLVVTIGSGALPAFVRGEDALMREIGIEGNADLASAVQYLFRHLRWDVEEDLAKFVGDVAARRLTGLARDAAAWHADAAKRIAASFMEYAVEERRVLVKRPALAEFSGAVARLRDGLERLEKRVERLERVTRGR